MKGDLLVKHLKENSHGMVLFDPLPFSNILFIFSIEAQNIGFQSWTPWVTTTSLLRYEVITIHPLPPSLRSKRFQSSYSRKLLRAEAKKRLKGDGEGRRGSFVPLPLPRLFFFLFCSCPSFLYEPREETLATQATFPLVSSSFFPLSLKTCFFLAYVVYNDKKLVCFTQGINFI